MSTNKIRGKLTVENLWSMPGNTPLFAKLPQYFPDAEVLQVFFEADPDGAAEIVPSDLEIPVPTEAIITFFKFPFSTLGPYNEFAVDIKVLLDGQEKYYTAYNYVNSDVGLAAGREIWGVPKKFAVLDIRRSFDLVYGFLERPEGLRLVTAVIRPEEPAKIEPLPITRLALKVIPPAGDGAEPLIQLVDRYRHRLTPKSVWTGPCTLTFNNRSDIDPLYRLGPRRIIRCVYGTFDYILDFGKVVKNYSRSK
ncbi:acetoacetate decarboxylase family protein [Vulcanisaeta thermophila]|uniref:acetoacetate decarboxylase family protein n=1 Tax=Vulcanisaeta thermophila TaxID=867917 RepID=UPI000852AEDA|nr:acetoacetate decarboxylase family protein [Vulcanisaeta thermophila]